ncbi:FAD-dependent oxidoreductase [Sinomonas mesophila]|uniref:FAD-dependent oxidoreductase n=1 Tax=Sinomonas mesophila TaxID=1531955 RepID=UPI0009867FB7|nr:FAD-dependent oxidoreductase [Sinomonas mesophila]
METHDVVIVGAGPVGLTLAVELGQRGKSVLVLEKRKKLWKLPKMERCNARTMENFRRMGLADRIREAGLDNEMSMDVFICDENLVNQPLVHHHYPSVSELKRQYREVNDGSAPAEPYQLISQYTLEPLLVEALAELPSVAVRFDAEVVSFTDDGESVTVRFRNADGVESSARAAYLVGCDGASSGVRKTLGFELEGDSLLEMRQALFYSETLLEQIPIGAGRHYHVADDKSSFLIVQDDKKHFSLHATVASDEEMPELFERILGFPVDYETLYVGSWRQRLMLSDGYSSGRVFIAGDAAHLVIPTGGLGMNTGHGDAVDLAWKLAAALDGWGGEALLESYELERRPIGARNIAASRKATMGRRKWRGMWSPAMTARDSEGDKARADLAAVADEEQRWSNDLYGIELGYGYLGSPVISYGEDYAVDELGLDFAYTPRTLEGFRLPNVRLDDGAPLQDSLGREYTILCVGTDAAAAQPLEDAIAVVGAPVNTLAVASEDARKVYGEGYLLLRPDLHIAWRGTQPPQDPAQLAALVTGHAAARGRGERPRTLAVVAGGQ